MLNNIIDSIITQAKLGNPPPIDLSRTTMFNEDIISLFKEIYPISVKLGRNRLSKSSRDISVSRITEITMKIKQVLNGELLVDVQKEEKVKFDIIKARKKAEKKAMVKVRNDRAKEKLKQANELNTKD